MWFLVFLTVATLAHAEPVISLPLDGYYRPGKFFPVKIDSDRDVFARVEADGISSTGRGRSMVLPAMSLSRVSGVVKVTIDGKTAELPIRPLEPDQKLQATLGAGSHIEEPVPRQLRVQLPSLSLADLTRAFESADMIVAYASSSSDLNDPVVAALTAAGVNVVVFDGEKPAMTLPFKDQQRGPLSSVDSAAAYNAAEALGPERSVNTRRMVWLSLALFAIVAVAASLARGRYAAAGVVAVGLVWLAGAAIVFARLPDVTERSGWVFLQQDGKVVDTHHWIFRTAAATTQDHFFADPLAVRPLFAGNAASMRMSILVENDQWRFDYTLAPNAKAIFLFYGQNQGPRGRSPTERTRTPVMMEIAKRYYQRQGDVLESNPGFEAPPVGSEVVTVKMK